MLIYGTVLLTLLFLTFFHKFQLKFGGNNNKTIRFVKSIFVKRKAIEDMLTEKDIDHLEFGDDIQLSYDIDLIDFDLENFVLHIPDGLDIKNKYSQSIIYHELGHYVTILSYKLKTLKYITLNEVYGKNIYSTASLISIIITTLGLLKGNHTFLSLGKIFLLIQMIIGVIVFGIILYDECKANYNGYQLVKENKGDLKPKEFILHMISGFSSYLFGINFPILVYLILM